MGCHAPLLELTPQQRAIARAMLRGEPAKQIALRIDRDWRTVAWHFTRIYRAAGVQSHAELIAWAHLHSVCCGWDAIRARPFPALTPAERRQQSERGAA